MDKRFLLALALCLLVLVVYQQFLAPPPPKKQDPKPAETTGGNPVQPDGGSAAPSTSPVVRAPVDRSQIRDEILENEVLRVVVTNEGAGIRTADLKDFAPTAKGKKEGMSLRILAESKSDLLHAFRLDDLNNADARLGETLWDMERIGDGSGVIFTKEVVRPVKDGAIQDGAVIYIVKKEITLASGRARHLRLRLSLEFKGDKNGEVLGTRFALLVSGGVFQEPGGQTMNPPRSALSAPDGKVTIVAVDEVIKSDKEIRGAGLLANLRGQKDPGGIRKGPGGSEMFVADLSNYLGAFFGLKGFPNNVTATVHVIGDRSSGRLAGLDDQGGTELRTATLLTIEEDLARGGEPKTHDAILYLGPLNSEILAADLGATHAELAEALSAVYKDQLGWASFVGRPVLWALRTLNGLTGNWGWAIVALTFCVRLLLFPINRKSQGAMIRQQEKMAVIKPRLEALKKKYEKEPKKYAEEQMKLMRQEKVPVVPLGGCLPVLLQMPIFFGLFAALRATIDLRQASWWWVQDLSQPDHLITFASAIPNPLALVSGLGCCCPMPQGDITGFHLLPILMTLAWVASSLMAPKPATTDPQMEMQRKMMAFMPLLFGFTMYGYAAGLSLYWLTSSLIGMVESQVIKRVWPLTKPAPKAQ